MMHEEILDFKSLEEIIAAYRGQKGALIPVLQKAQKIYGYLPSEVLQKIAAVMRIPISRVYGVVTFYAQFYLTRRGRHIIRQCDGTACHVRGAGKIIDKVEKEFGIKAGDTTPDYKLSWEVVYCLGSCGLAPAAVVDEKTVGKIAPEHMVGLIRGLE